MTLLRYFGKTLEKILFSNISKTKKDIEKPWYIIVKNILMNKYVKNQIDWNRSF